MKETIDIVVISLFDGLSGARLALDEIDYINVLRYYSSEIEEHPITVANNNYPQDTPYRLGSVIDIDTKKLLDEIQKDFGPDIKILLVGGSPCQGFSMAGKLKGSSTKEGIDVVTLEQYLSLKADGFEFDGQSYLFWEYVRIKEDIQPDYWLLENVRITKKWLPMFNNTMGVKEKAINSNLLSAQNRPRFYWSNIPMTTPTDANILWSDISEDLPFRELKPFVFGYFGENQRIKGMKTTKSNKANCCTTSKTHTNQYYLNEDRTKMRNLSINEYEALQTIPKDYTIGVPEGARFKMIGNGFTRDVIAHIFKGIK